ncbi:MAG: response regulator transcription factor [Coriobacteriia bacterium]|nr:response regulator transcription factor [Coriobacteriia bacterium]
MATPKNILVVEDDSHISDLLCALLKQQGHHPVPAYSGTEALLVLGQNHFDLVLLDLMLPGKTGEEVLEEIRNSSAVPVIVLTARTDKETTVQLLQLGADDYIAKPFDNDELLARIEVQVRRLPLEQSVMWNGQSAHSRNQSAELARTLQHKDITLNLDEYDAFIGNQRAKLSKREFEILHLLMSHPKKVFSKNNLYESVWGEDFFGDDNTLNVHISKLRAKLQTLSPDAEHIQTVWGIGFRMKE